MAITEEKILQNKERFLSILKPAIEARPNVNIEGLLNKLETSDFFIAPASTKYHSNFKGGLCEHSLNVYDNLMVLIKSKGLENEIDMDGATIVGLLHDIGKIGCYQVTAKNVKVYSETGSKRDELGRFDWEAKTGYTSIPDNERSFILGNHEENCEYMLSWFVPLKPEESASILVHHGGIGYDSADQTAPKVMQRYKLATLLHLADLMSAYIDEVIDE